MTRKTFAYGCIGLATALTLLVALIAPVVHAHHSIAGQFDMTKTLRLTGVVSKLEWVNPHVYVHLDAKDEQGASATWKLETLPVAMLRKAGIKKQMLISGETVNMDVCPARNGTAHLGFILNIKFPDGRRFQFSRDPNGGVTATP
jgi:hypothetical protein